MALYNGVYLVTIDREFSDTAARRYAIGNLKCFCIPQATSDPIWMVAFTFTMRRHLIRLASTSFASFRLVGLRLLTPVCDAWQRRKTQILRMVGKISGHSLAVCVPKFTKFWDYVGYTLHFPLFLSDCLWHVSFRRHSPLSLEVVEQPNKHRSFLAPHFWRDDPNFLSTDR